VGMAVFLWSCYVRNSGTRAGRCTRTRVLNINFFQKHYLHSFRASLVLVSIYCRFRRTVANLFALQTSHCTASNFIKYSQSRTFSNVHMKVKVKLSPCLINQALCHKDIWSGAITPPFLISSLDGGEWSASRPRHLRPGKEPSVPIG
jgi:hypothetical protein